MALHHPNIVQFWTPHQGFAPCTWSWSWLPRDTGRRNRRGGQNGKGHKQKWPQTGQGGEKEGEDSSDIARFRPPQFVRWAWDIALPVTSQPGYASSRFEASECAFVLGQPPVCRLCDFGISKRTRRTKKQNSLLVEFRTCRGR